MSKTNKVVWSDEILYFIIKYIKAAPYIWDPSHPLYSFKAKKAKFWPRLAEKVNNCCDFYLNTAVTKEALQKKWTNMKTYYFFEESKSRNTSAEADNLSSTWKFRSTLSFLNPSMDKSSHTPAPSANESEVSNDDPLATRNVTIKEELSEVSFNEDEESVPTPSPSPTPPPSKRPKTCSDTNVRLNQTNYYHYGMTISQDLDQLDEEYRTEAKLEIMQIIAKFKREQLLNKTTN
ncbi:uncharacterized protein LOC108604018 [Drosophila busckii]|uniref:uncharacterized protein LOC108604018 n=1 Tax=Drosophila busckii TaxID=30019 RepID=UPI00083EECF0|nr:uncharacterized protein LOC108604018 [Drosophila busckii]